MESGHGLVWWSALAALGLGIGFIAGLFGVGGGFLLTPLLATLYGVPISIAVGTGLCQMIGTATAAQIRYARLRTGDAKLGSMMLVGSLCGVDLGRRSVDALAAMGDIVILGHPIPAARFWLSLGYVVLLGGVAVWMRRDTARPALAAGLAVPPGPLARLRLPPYTRLERAGHRVSIPVIAYLGLGIGFLSGLLGIGGGVLLVPVLLYGIGMRMSAASGTGISILLASSIVGTLGHARSGHVALGIALTLMVGSALGAQAGATMAVRWEGRRLRRLFVYLVALTGAAVALDLAGKVAGR